MKKIAAAGAPFVSRGDNSGTSQFELGVWQQASIEPGGQAWYIESGTGMGQTLIIAGQKQAYTISDRATWLAQTGKIDLPILVERDPSLLNVYHVMPVNQARFPNVRVNASGGQAFAEFMVAAATQQVIGEFGTGTYGQQLFVPDAGKSESNVGLQPESAKTSPRSPMDLLAEALQDALQLILGRDPELFHIAAVARRRLRTCHRRSGRLDRSGRARASDRLKTPSSPRSFGVHVHCACLFTSR